VTWSFTGAGILLQNANPKYSERSCAAWVPIEAKAEKLVTSFPLVLPTKALPPSAQVHAG
jgi:hypothetical protein